MTNEEIVLSGDAIAIAVKYLNQELKKQKSLKSKWVVEDGLLKIYKCPKCGQIVMTDDIEVYRFCHGCGMKMEGVKYEQTE